MTNENTNTTEETTTPTIISTDAIASALEKAKNGEAEHKGRKRLSDEERALRDEAKAKEREEKRLAREAKKAARESEKAAKKPHMTKVEKAAERLPTLSENASRIMNDMTDELTDSEIVALMAHVNHRLRVAATHRSADKTFDEGQTVRIVSGSAQHLGELARVTKCARIRCYVETVNGGKKVYLFTTDIEAVDSEVESLPQVEASTDDLSAVG